MYQQPEYWAARPAGMDATDHSQPIAEWRTGRNARVKIGGTIYDMGAFDNPATGLNFGGNCAIGGCWYAGTDFPVEYQDTYIQADYGAGWIKSFKLSATNEVQAVRNIANSAGGIVYVATHPETGSLYYIPFGGSIMKVSYVGGTPPMAQACADRTWGTSPLTVAFSSEGSAEPNGGALRYLWDFGDGTTSALANPTHTFTAASVTSFLAMLTVYSSDGFEQSATVRIHLNNSPPRVHITSPINLTHYPLNQGNLLYNLTADVSDAQSSNAALSYSWITRLHHNEHEHPEPPDSAPSTTAVITPVGPGSDPQGHGDDSVYYYVIELTVTDPQGLSSKDAVKLVPNVGNLAVETTDDAVNVERGGGQWIPVLENDLGGITDADFASLQVVTAPLYGSIVIDAATGTIRYLNNGDTAVTDSFTYRIATLSGSVSLPATVNITVMPPPTGTITGAVTCAEEPPVGALNTTSTDLDLGLGDDNLQWIVGMRFGGLAIPQGAKVTAAAIQFTVDNSPASITPVNLLIQGEASGNAAFFEDAYARPSFRPRTVANAAWQPIAWPTVGQRGSDQLTPSLAGIVQEIINRNDWATGNFLGMFITGTGHVEAESTLGAIARNDLSLAPQLSITYNGWCHRPLGSRQRHCHPIPAHQCGGQ